MKKLLLSVFMIAALSFQLPEEEKKLKLELTVPQTEIVLKALSKLPFEESSTLIYTIQIQANKQLADTTKPKK